MPPLLPPHRPWALLALLLLALPLTCPAPSHAAAPDGGVVVLVSRDYINLRGGRPRTDPVDVEDEVGGFSVRTRGEGRAYPKIHLVPCDVAAVFHVVTRGTGTSISEGRRERLCLVSSHSSTFCLEQVICLTGHGVSGRVTGVKAEADSKLVCVATDRKCGDRLVRFGVRAGFALAPGRINQLATERANTYTRRRANEFLQQLIRRGNEVHEERLLNAVRRYDVRPEDIHFHTTRDHVRVHVDAGTGPTGPERPLSPGTAVALQVHQSLIEGRAARSAGRRITGKEIQKVLQPAARRAGVTLPTTLADVDWSITLAKRDPVRLRIEDEHFDLTVRLDGFSIDEQTFPPIEVHTRYRLEQRDGWPLLRRQGRVGARVLDEKKRPDGERWREELVELLEGILLPELPLAKVMRDELAPLVRQSGLQEKPRVSARHGWLLAEYDAAPEAGDAAGQPQAGPPCPR